MRTKITYSWKVYIPERPVLFKSSKLSIKMQQLYKKCKKGYKKQLEEAYD